MALETRSRIDNHLRMGLIYSNLTIDALHLAGSLASIASLVLVLRTFSKK